MKRYFSLILAIAATVSAQIVPSTGNVRGPTSATDNAVARYDGTTGKLVQNSGVTIDDSGNLTVSGAAAVNGGNAIYGGGALLLGGSGGDSGNAVYTTDTGSPTIYTDHRGTSNTGDWYWRNGTGGANTRMILSGSGNLTVSGTGTSTFGGTVRAGAGSGETLSAGSVDVTADIGIKTTQGIVQGGARIVTFTSGNATFAGRIGLTASGTNPIYSNFIPDAANTYAGLITMQAGGGSASYGGGLQLYGHSHATKPGWVSANISAGSSGKFAVNDSGLGGGTDVFTVDSTGNATFAGAIAIGNTVNTVSPTSPNRTITMVIGGTTYYIHAKTTND